MSSNANLSFIGICWFSLVFIRNRWFSLVFIKSTMKNQWKPSLVMMRECPCSTKTREVLENPSTPPLRFPLAMGFAPLDPRVSGCKTHGRGKSLKISLDPREFLRASLSGNLSGLGKSWASGMDFPIPPSSWWSKDTNLPTKFYPKHVNCNNFGT